MNRTQQQMKAILHYGGLQVALRRAVFRGRLPWYVLSSLFVVFAVLRFFFVSQQAPLTLLVVAPSIVAGVIGLFVLIVIWSGRMDHHDGLAIRGRDALVVQHTPPELLPTIAALANRRSLIDRLAHHSIVLYREYVRINAQQTPVEQVQMTEQSLRRHRSAHVDTLINAYHQAQQQSVVVLGAPVWRQEEEPVSFFEPVGYTVNLRAMTRVTLLADAPNLYRAGDRVTVRRTAPNHFIIGCGDVLNVTHLGHSVTISANVPIDAIGTTITYSISADDWARCQRLQCDPGAQRWEEGHS